MDVNNVDSEGEHSPEVEEESSEEEQFDVSLAASHSYMGTGLITLSGRVVLEPGWEGRVPVVAHHGVVFPGETVPMLVPSPHDATVLSTTIKHKQLFGLLCPDYVQSETGGMVSGYGVLCEVFEAGLGVEPQPSTLSFKARASHRFRFLHMPKTSIPIHLFSKMRYVDVVSLPDVGGAVPLRHGAALCSLHPLRDLRPQLDTQLRAMDAALTPWPAFVYDMFDYGRMRAIIKDYFNTMNLDKLPEDAVSLSFWVASNLTLSPRDRLALFVVDHALLRLYMEVRHINKFSRVQKSAMCCSACGTEVAKRENVFAMSSDGVHSNYTNLGGFMHDIVTVTAADNITLSGLPSVEFSWFPGYSWTIALCYGCTAHVGWRFDAMKRTLRPQQFFGLCRNYVQPRAHTADL